MRNRIFALIILIIIILPSVSNISLGYRLSSDKGKYSLNIDISMMYRTEVFDKPFGREDLPDKGFLVDDSGGMTNEKGQRGEYAYLGYNFENQEIPNDRYFRSIESRGNAFDQNYSNVEWQEIIPEAPNSWKQIERDSVLLNYILTTNFYDEDHPTEGKSDTGFNLLKLFNIPEGSTDYSEIYRKAWVLTSPDTGSAHIQLRYNNTNWNTIRIPAIPRIECIMTAEADKSAIETGKTESVTITIDTGYSYWVMADKESKEISERRYWAGTDSMVESEVVTSKDSVCRITLHNVSPNTMIHVWSSVTSHEIEGLGFDGTDDAVATLFIGEITPSGSTGTGNKEIKEQFTSPDTQAIIKADQRGNERFDVSKGIPSGETLYANILTSEYLYRLSARKVTGTVHDTITVHHLDEEGDFTTSHESFERSYSYYEITSLEVYAIKSATLVNGALPGGRITLTPTSAYKRPDVEFVDIENHVSKGRSSLATSYSSDPQEIRAVASSNLPSLSVKSDALKINGKVIISENGGFFPERLDPEITNANALFQSGLKIPPEVLNQSYGTTGTITYERVYAVNPRGDQEITFPIEGNSVSVHTPVCIDFTVSNDAVHNQKPEPIEGISGLVLTRPFTVSLSNHGSHRDIPGYGRRDYSAYVKDRQVRFGFDTYLGTDREGTFLKGDTWYSLKDLGIDSRQDQITFYTPFWVDEGVYEIEIRSLATNDNSDGSKVEEHANLSPSNYAAYKLQLVEVSGRVYDLKVTDIDDPGWEAFFRKAEGKPEPSGKVFFTGPRNINGERETQRKHILPVMPGKNDVPGYQNRAVKLGYAVRFEIRTIGNYYDRYDFLQIIPTFYFVDKEGKNRQEVDLYYSTPSAPLIKIGSDRDTLTNTMKMDFKRRGIDLKEFSDTAGAMHRIRGGMNDYSLEEWVDIFPQISKNGVTAYKFSKVLLSEPVRSYLGPLRNIPEGVNTDKALASIQKWYGEYCLPADCLVVPKGTDLSKERNLTSSSPVFLKDGYIIVNFRDISVINDDDFENPSLKYTGKTGDGWSLEGYVTNQNGWELEPGDVVVYYADKRATDDYYSAGTH
jgi:hypothetical protein